MPPKVRSDPSRKASGSSIEVSAGPVSDSATCTVTAVFASCALFCPTTESWKDAISVSTSGVGIKRAGIRGRSARPR